MIRQHTNCFSDGNWPRQMEFITIANTGKAVITEVTKAIEAPMLYAFIQKKSATISTARQKKIKPHCVAVIETRLKFVPVLSLKKTIPMKNMTGITNGDSK